jgi:hypothetical protein
MCSGFTSPPVGEALIISFACSTCPPSGSILQVSVAGGPFFNVSDEAAQMIQPTRGDPCPMALPGLCALPQDVRNECLGIFDLPGAAENGINPSGLNFQRKAGALVTPLETKPGGRLTLFIDCNSPPLDKSCEVDLLGPGAEYGGAASGTDRARTSRAKNAVYHARLRVLGKRVAVVRVPKTASKKGASASKKHLLSGLFKFLFGCKKKKKSFQAGKKVGVAPPPPAPPAGGGQANCASPPPSTFLISPSNASPGGQVSFLLSCTTPASLGFQGAFAPLRIRIYDSTSFHNLKYNNGVLVPGPFPARPPILITPGAGAFVTSGQAITVTLPSSIQPGVYVAVIDDAQGQVASQNELRVP